MNIETRISLRGRTLAGYANWNLNGTNRIRLNVNKMWSATGEWCDSYVEARRKSNRKPVLPLADLHWILFLLEFCRTDSHERMHCIFHQEREVRRYGDHFKEGILHHAVLAKFDDFFWES